jgi:aminocarboxymuconate-semialdehyde decarboxylase
VEVPSWAARCPADRPRQRALDHPDLREFFSAADELGMLGFVHPLNVGVPNYWTDRVAGPAVTFGLGMTTDTAIAASRLVFGGVTADYPALRICLAHGGAFFWALPRIARMWDATNDTTSEELTRNVFADSLVHRTANLTYLCDMIGTGRIVFGTDYPFAPPEDAQGANLPGSRMTMPR